MKSYDAVVAGGGLIGASIALELASEGLRVAVFDVQEPGREASWASAGMISPAPENSAMASLLPISMASVRLYPAFIQRVEEISGKSVGYRKDGALDLLLDGTGQSEIDEILALHRGAGLRAEALSGPEARELERACMAAALDGIEDEIQAEVEVHRQVGTTSRDTSVAEKTFASSDASRSRYATAKLPGNAASRDASSPAMLE